MIGVLKHSDDYDITSAIELILVNLPNDISIMESIRLIYVRLGRIFSYDYNVASDINIALRKNKIVKAGKNSLKVGIELKDQKGNSHFLEFNGDDAAEIRKNQSNPAKLKETIIKIRNKYNS